MEALLEELQAAPMENTGLVEALRKQCVRKDTDPEILLAAVRAVAAGKTYIDPAIARQLTRTPDPDALTPREAEMLRHVASGESNRAIAAALGVSEETVKTHVANLLSKLQAENRAQATVQGLKRGLISLDDTGQAVR
jgi:DNA-binding NarL/FixJ family response regulator